MPEDDFKTHSAKLLMPRDPTKMWNWDLKVWQIPLIIWAQSTSKIFLDKISQEHPQIGKSYVGKNKINLNDTKPKILL